jgi:hypothetical protein
MPRCRLAGSNSAQPPADPGPFAGCAIVIARDRWFPDRITTHITAFEGNLSEYEEWRRQQPGGPRPGHIGSRTVG